MHALINYARNPEPLVSFRLDTDWTGITPHGASVEIADARSETNRLSLEEQGFVIDRLPTMPLDYLDPVQVGRHWIPAVRALVQRLTGAVRVLPWAVNVRFSNRSAHSLRTNVAAPARHVHCDFNPRYDPSAQTVWDAPTLASLGMTGGTAALIASRPRVWRCFNVWQQISPPPQDTPLALCDASSVAPQDVLVGRGRYDAGPDSPAGSVDLGLFRHNPDHRWYYFADLLPGETLVFSGLDPSAGPTCRMVPHIAFDHPDCPPDAPARNSIEVRVLAVFEA